ncbi:type II toxin-antitoxin system VapC family toxin [Thermodesulfatator autotrophicus]|uniref:Ribonuclease VapC n=1 Tax=Thermodesulfatator autotrophicus TaxID=1795632 RepID=A0A177EBT9_9BACT|nr:PIN domain-containing protein [Thermodesulfatator autotrophicus]OAG28469.1 hypothetical protein TH606_01835 [Thermodesulfatator autotrophicus]
MKERAVLDTSFLVACLCERDVHHRRAREIFRETLRDLHPIVPDVIYGEAVSVLARRSREWGFEFGQALRELRAICPRPARFAVYLLEEFDDIIRLVEDTEGRLNFNDALIVVGAREERIKKIVSFDSDFDGYMERIG